MTNWLASLSRDRTQQLQLLAFFIGLFAASYLGILLGRLGDTSPALIWPAAGVALAGLVLGGLGLWPAIFCSMLAAYLLTGTDFVLALILAGAGTIQAIVALLLLRLFKFDPLIGRLHDALVIMGTALVAALVVPTLGTITMVLEGTAPSNIAVLIAPWWTGEVLSLIVIAPFVIRWLIHFRFTRSRSEWIETILAFVALVAVGLILFFTPYAVYRGIPLVYLILFPLMWIGLRIGPRAMTLALLLIAAAALVGTAMTGGGLGAEALGMRLVLAEIFAVIMSFIFLTLTATAEERKNATKTLERHVEELERALVRIKREDETKNDFIAMLAHELRNPLAPLLSSLELLRLQEPEGDRREQVNAMRGRVRTMARLLDDLLDISRISRGKLEITRESMDLETVVHRGIETVEPQIKLRGQHITFEALGNDMELFADPLRIEQVIVNLLNNASKCTPRGGSIKVAIAREGKDATVRVRDTGVGIEPDLLSKIFQPFHQGEAARRMGSGLGVGLALSRNLVELHGGTIEAISEGENKGSEFIVRIPRPTRAFATQPLSKERSRQLKRIAAPEKGLRILVVDDNHAAAESLKELLSYIGHTVETAATGGETFGAAKSFTPDAIILDIGLPDINGYEVAERLREQGEPAALIALTGYGQDEDKRRATEAGFDYHLTKPAGLTDIEAVLRQIAE